MRLEQAIAVTVAAALKQHSFTPLSWKAVPTTGELSIPSECTGLFWWSRVDVCRTLTIDSANHIVRRLAKEFRSKTHPLPKYTTRSQRLDALETIKRRGSALNLTSDSEAWWFVTALNQSHNSIAA